MAKHNGNTPFRLYKRGNTWHAYISCRIAGRRIVIRETTGCKTESDAQEWATKRIAQLANTPAVTHEITLDAAATKWWLEYGQNLSSHVAMFSMLRNLLKQFNPALPLSQISKLDISNFIADSQRMGRTPATINRYLCCLSAICTRARNYWECNTPTFRILGFRLREPHENIKYFTDMAEINTLVAHAAEHLRPIIWCALYTGMRRGRVLSLQWKQIDWANNQIIYMGKDNQPHSVPLVKPLADILRNLPRTSDFVFTYKGLPIADVKLAWHAAFRRAGIPYRNFHALRHTTATWLLRQSGNLKVVQQVLGHHSLQVTTKYAHLVNNESENAMNALFCTKSAQCTDPHKPTN